MDTRRSTPGTPYRSEWLSGLDWVETSDGPCRTNLWGLVDADADSLCHGGVTGLWVGFARLSCSPSRNSWSWFVSPL